MAPAATILNVAVTYVDDRGAERYGFALVPTTAAGRRVPRRLGRPRHAGLGVRVGVVRGRPRSAPTALRDGFPAGAYSAALLERYLASGALPRRGVARHRRGRARQRIVTRPARRVDTALTDPHAVTELAANVVDLAAMRASFDRAGHLIDEYVTAHPTGDATMADAQAVYGEVQAAKAFLTAAAVRVVDRALALSGGAGYLAAPPARQGVAGRPGRRVHAPARRQPGRRTPRPHRPRRRRRQLTRLARALTATRRASSIAASPSSAAPSASAAS